MPTEKSGEIHKQIEISNRKTENLLGFPIKRTFGIIEKYNKAELGFTRLRLFDYREKEYK